MSSSRRLSRRSALAVLAAGCGMAALFTAGCKASDAPAEPVWGKEPCASCKMLVGDKRYAAHVIDESGEHRFFDDIGCMVLWMDGHRAPSQAWVRDPATGSWLDARTARYVQGARTPMDFGFEARVGGEVAFETVRVAVLERKRSSR
jgi:nitrous oxide reductase accessory protein NosL